MQLNMFVFLFMTLFLQRGFGEGKPCAFCKEEVIAKQVVFESDYFFILLDYEPRVEGHLLVVSKEHKMKAHELSNEQWSELSAIIPKAVSVFQTHLGTDEYIILEKNGPRAFQDVPHVDFHLFPIQTQKIRDILLMDPLRFTNEELQAQVALYRECFLSGG